MGRPVADQDRASQRLLDHLSKHLDVIEPDGKILVAISGGTDSTALLLALNRLAQKGKISQQIEAAHFNHQLRGDASDGDEAFCRELCASLSVQLHVGRDENSSGPSAKTATEAASRDLRYHFLADLALKYGFSCIATAHTQDDQAETVLLAMTRGAGLRGIGAMPVIETRNDLPGNLSVFRPLLDVTREDTSAFCEALGVTPREDESNSDVAFARNRIRHKVLPELREINPQVVEALSRLSQAARSDIELIESAASNALYEARIDEPNALSRSKLKALNPTLRAHVLIGAYRQAAGTLDDLASGHIESMVTAAGSEDTGSLNLPNAVQMVAEHNAVRFLVSWQDPTCPYPESVNETVLPILKTVKLQGGGVLSARIVWPAPDPATLTRFQAIISPDVVDDQKLAVRARHKGDRFHPFGMETEMKLQDFLVNQHVPERWRDRIPLLVTSRGICWVVGERIAEWAKVPEGASEAVLLEYVPPTESAPASG